MGRVVACLGKPFLFLRFGAVPDKRHEGQTVHKQNTTKTGVNCSDFFHRNQDVDVGESATAILLRKESSGKSKFVGLLVGRSDHLKTLLRIRLGIGRPNQGL